MDWLRLKGASGFSYYSTAEDVTKGVDASGLTAIITGASSGIGSEATRVLALRGVHVIMAVRNVEAGNEVKENIVKEISNAKLDVLELDLCSLASVRKFAANFEAMNLPLNILINNAGIMAAPFKLSKDGIELQFATNHLGHFLLTNLLLENMKATARKTGIEGRIVIVSSEGYKMSYKGGFRFDKLNDEAGYGAYQAYGQSKLANILHANELARRLQEGGDNVTVNSLHPGTINTNLGRYSKFLRCMAIVMKYALKNIPQGASTECYLALNPRLKGVTGKYFYDNNEAPRTALATNKDLAKQLWEFSEKLVS